MVFAGKPNGSFSIKGDFETFPKNPIAKHFVIGLTREIFCPFYLNLEYQ